MNNALTDYKEMIGKVVDSDDASAQEVYRIANEELKNADKARELFFDLADKVRADLSKCLDNPDMSAEEQNKIREQELEILRMASEKDNEIRAQEVEMANIADKKDSEKRMFNWKLIGTISLAIVSAVGLTAGLLGGEFKLPGGHKDI